MDPSTIDLEQLYQDNLPPETKQIEDFLNNYRGEKNEQEVDVEKVKLEKFEKKRRIEDDILPPEGKDHMKISQLRV